MELSLPSPHCFRLKAQASPSLPRPRRIGVMMLALGLAIALAFIPASCQAVTVKPKQVQVLTDCLKAWGQPPLQGWNTPWDCDNINYVTCDQSGNIVQMSLTRNQLTGSIPASLGSLTGLLNLDLERNHLTGNLPASLGNLTGLGYLNLGYNQLTGSLPASLGNLTGLISLSLTKNQLTGSLPTSLGSLIGLESLDLSYNSLSGSLPPFLGSLLSIRILFLDDNKFVGNLPPVGAKLKLLERLDLSNNQLTGSLPPEPYFNFPVWLSGNYLTGNISGARFSCFDSVGLNCFSDSPTCSKQRNQSDCAQFCGTTSLYGACGGHGTCAIAANNTPTCSCSGVFIRDPSNPGSCITKVKQGAVLNPKGELYLNRWFRHVSRGFSYQNYVPSWSIRSVSSWMAPHTLFIGYNPSKPPRSGILSWSTIRDQGNCSSCWAAAAVDAVAAAQVLATSPAGGNITLPTLNRVLVCTKNSGGCLGDYPTSALEYAAQNEQTSIWSGCIISRGTIYPKIMMYESVQFRSWFGLLLTVQFQPAIIILQGSSFSFQGAQCSKTFIMADPNCYNGTLDHSVLVVGYDISYPQPYWVVRNSWGPDWCSSGYMRLLVQGGDGTCGMNALPAYYPVPAASVGDPCYTNSTTPSGENNPAFNPCGGGRCIPLPVISPGSYTCQCPDGFVPAWNIQGPGSQDNTSSCIPVDACSLSLENPCGTGTCINDEHGSYSCICPLGYLQGSFTDGSPTCTRANFDRGVPAFYVAATNVNADVVAAVYGIVLVELIRQNKGVLNCSAQPCVVPAGTRIDVTNPGFSCSSAYTATSLDQTCSDISDRFDGTPSLAELSSVNPGADCTSLIPGQLICLSEGDWLPPFICTQYKTLSVGDDCTTVVRGDPFLGDPVLFFQLNPGIDCSRITFFRDSVSANIGSKGATVCTASSPIGTTLCRPDLQYTVKRGDKCLNLWNKLGFNSMRDMISFNKKAVLSCGKPLTVGSIICYRKKA